MNRGVKFWVFVSIFQIVFGLTVFALTRHYYSQDNPQQTTQQTSQTTGAEMPGVAAGNELEQLMDLYPAQPLSSDPQDVLLNADEHFVAGRYQKAAEGYAQLVQMGAADVDIYNNLGITLHYLGRSGEALKILDEGIAANPLYQRIWLTQGFVNSQAGNMEQARAAFEMAVSLDAESEVGRAAQQMLIQLAE
jgi:tetratricopeptide (TPR) repeat protein